MTWRQDEALLEPYRPRGERSLTEVAAMTGLTKQAVLDIERRALRKLRQSAVLQALARDLWEAE